MRKRGTQDCEILIIAYTEQKLITLQLAAQPVLVSTERRGRYEASVTLGQGSLAGERIFEKYHILFTSNPQTQD